jgi:hypothetical protein
MSKQKLTGRTRTLTVIVPDDLYVRFTLAVLKTAGPKAKMKVLAHLMERYISETEEKERQEQRPPALRLPISTQPEGRGGQP